MHPAPRLFALAATLAAGPACFTPVWDGPVEVSPPAVAAPEICREDLRAVLPSTLASGGAALFEAWPPSVPPGGFLWVRGAGLRDDDAFELSGGGPLARAWSGEGEVALRVPEALAPGSYALGLRRGGETVGCTLPVRVHQGQVRFVAPGGDDAAVGTLEAPWRTVASAVERLQPGDFTYLREGTWDGEVDVTASGEPGRPIALAGFPGEKAHLTRARRYEVCIQAPLTVSGSDVLLDRLTVSTEVCLRAVHVRGRWLFEDADTRRVTVSNSDLSGAWSSGLFVAAPGSRVHRNRLHHNGPQEWPTGYGLVVFGAGTRVTANLAHDNREGGFGIGGEPPDPGLEPIELAGNVAWNNVVGLVVLETAQPVVVRGNVACRNTQVGFLGEDTANTLFDANVSCLNPLGVQVKAPRTPVWILGNVSIADQAALDLAPGVVSKGNVLEERLTDEGKDRIAAWDFCTPATPALCGPR